MRFSRITYAAAVMVCIALGLGSRKYAGLLPSWVAEHAGDVLWASMVYFGFRLCFIAKGPKWAAAAGILFSFGIECSQLYQAAWIVAIRNTVLGSLVLGRGFLAVDLVRYALGILLAYGVDKVWLAYRK
ncbi:DUF2809 domain-containing protein [Paenibacillus sp. TAB 01]|uniref:ribosomal maturation YjgA family protein n=1 Tax=Paenibacillus sp. TAB 01 TaxID=3368988 RepID=UPI003751FB5A